MMATNFLRYYHRHKQTAKYARTLELPLDRHYCEQLLKSIAGVHAHTLHHVKVTSWGEVTRAGSSAVVTPLEETGK